MPSISDDDDAPLQPSFQQGKKLGSRRTAPRDFPEAKTYYPTMAELRDWPTLVQKLEDDNAHTAGICKLVPPKEWRPRRKGYTPEDFADEFDIERPIKQVLKQVGDKGMYQATSMSQEPMTVRQYYDMANSTQYRTPAHTDYDDLERKYWKQLPYNPAIYGADNSKTITDKDVEECNIARLGTILKYVEEDQDLVIAGVNSPYIYFGMWKATFVWHVEDMDLYGINFVHHGAPKTWYCVPPKYGHLLEKLAKKLFPNIADWCSNFMRHKTCLISPQVLEEHGVPYQKVVQEERAIIIVFPYAYHAGFNHGFNVAESTNFASKRWIEYGKRYRPCDCTRDTVKVDMTNFVRRFQPERLEAWKNNLDIAPHPEDPPEVVAEIQERARDPEAYAKKIAEKLKAEGKKNKDGGVDGQEVQVFRTDDGRFLRFNLQTGKFLGCKEQPTLSASDEKLLEAWRQKFEEEEDTILDEEGLNVGSTKKSNMFVILDVYQHVTLKHIRVAVYKDTYRICGRKALQNFRDDMNKQEIQNLKDYVENGVLVKTGSKTKFRKNRLKKEPTTIIKRPRENDSEDVSSAKKPKHVAHIYAHKTRQDIAVTIKPDTFEFVGKPADSVLEVMATDDMDFKTLVERGVFVFVSEVDTSPSEGIVKEEPKEEPKELVKEIVKEVVKEIASPPVSPQKKGAISDKAVYRHKPTGKEFTVAKRNKRPVGNESREVLESLLEPGQSFRDIKEQLELVRSIEGTPMAISRLVHTCLHVPSDCTFNINPKNFKIAGRKSNKLATAIDGKDMKEMIESGEVKVTGEKRTKPPGIPAGGARMQKFKLLTLQTSSGMRVDVGQYEKRTVARWKSDSPEKKNYRNTYLTTTLKKLIANGDLTPVTEGVNVLRLDQIETIARNGVPYMTTIQYCATRDPSVSFWLPQGDHNVPDKYRDSFCGKTIEELVADQTLQVKKTRYNPDLRKHKMFNEDSDLFMDVSEDVVMMEDRTLQEMFVVRSEEQEDDYESEEVQGLKLELSEDNGSPPTTTFKSKAPSVPKITKQVVVKKPIPEPKPVQAKVELKPEPKVEEEAPKPEPEPMSNSESDFSDSDAYSDDAFDGDLGDDDSDALYDSDGAAKKRKKKKSGSDSDSDSDSDEEEEDDDDDFRLGRHWNPDKTHKRSMFGTSKKRRKEKRKQMKLMKKRRGMKRKEGNSKGDGPAGQIKSLVHYMKKKREELLAAESKTDAPVEKEESDVKMEEESESTEAGKVEEAVEAQEAVSSSKTLYLKREEVVIASVVSKENLDVAIPILKGLEVVTEDEAHNLVWHGLDQARLRENLLEVLEGDSDEKEDTWSMCKRVLKLLIKTNVKSRCYHIRNLSAILYGPDVRDRDVRDVRRELVRSVVNVLRGIRVMERVSGTTDLKFIGPEGVYEAFLAREWERFDAKEYGLKTLKLPVRNSTAVTSDMKKIIAEKLYGGTSSRNLGYGHRLEEKRLMALSLVKGGMVIDAQQERSLKNFDRVCNCGGFRYMEGNRGRVKTGFKKRSRCKKCPGCLATKCEKCNNCLTPSNKQSCVLKKCLFPVTPKCPCFD